MMEQGVPQALADFLDTLGLRPRGDLQALAGGDMAAVYRLPTGQGDVVVKSDAPERLAGEADGLRALAAASSGLLVPEVLGLSGDWMVMQALDVLPGRPDATALGEGLRRLHAVTGETHGWPCDNACGRTPQANGPLADGRVFQRERRLLPLAEACHSRGLLDGGLHQRIEAVARDLEAWLPDALPALVHGDLWSGNVLATPAGPAIIDPAVYRHYPEVDLAMLTLFGAPEQAFFDAYWDGAAPHDWSRRELLFQLYPLLNHLLLFGGGYRSAVEQAVGRLARSSAGP